jgi:hypothetical protein
MDVEAGQKKLKPLRTVETRWMSLEAPAQRVHTIYPVLVAKFAADAAKNVAEAQGILDRLLTLESMLGLTIVLPMLRILQRLNKTFQKREVTMMDLKESRQMTEATLKKIYGLEPVDVAVPASEPESASYNALDFSEYHELAMSDDSRLCWDPTDEESLVYRDTQDKLHPVTTKSVSDSGRRLLHGAAATNGMLKKVMEQGQKEGTAAAKSVLDGMKGRFLPNSTMDALSIVYPQAFKAGMTKKQFRANLEILVLEFGTARTTIDGGIQVQPPLNGALLKEQAGFYYDAMKDVGLKAYEQLSDEDMMIPATMVWRRLVSSPAYLERFSEFAKAAQLALTMVGGSVEEERTFSGMTFLKSNTRNRLDGHLDLAMRMFSQDFYTVENFPYHKAFKVWQAEKQRRGN